MDMVRHSTGNVYSGHITDIRNIVGNQYCE